MVLRLVNIMCASEYANLSVKKKKIMLADKNLFDVEPPGRVLDFCELLYTVFLKHKNSNSGIVCVMDT